MEEAYSEESKVRPPLARAFREKRMVLLYVIFVLVIITF